MYCYVNGWDVCCRVYNMFSHKVRCVDLAEFRKEFAKAKNIAIITGAGVSAESGVPTFRGQGGYWRKWQAQVIHTCWVSMFWGHLKIMNVFYYLEYTLYIVLPNPQPKPFCNFTFLNKHLLVWDTVWFTRTTHTHRHFQYSVDCTHKTIRSKNIYL